MWMPVHDPREPYFRSPAGAVQAGTEITLRIETPRTFEVRDAFLSLRTELPGGTECRELPMRRAEPRDCGYDAFEGSFAPGETGLAFYHFTLCRDGGLPYYYGKMEPDPEHPDITGGIYNTPEVPAWQITLYRPQDTPDWFGKGVTYGIFPDRFARDPSWPADRPLKPWGADPDYRPSPDGITRREDCFGGNLRGIRGRLSYLERLGVTTIYLNPVFRARSNHRYDTGDYESIDPLLGDTREFSALCRDAHARGMRVLLDGVFSHTGADSRYFNAFGTYPDTGAAQSAASPYYPWYTFRHWPDDYECWWDVRSLPRVNKESETYLDYIVRGENSIVRRWLRAGADGYRLDVADELPDRFLEELRRAVREEKPDAVVIGEVWEDASNKIAYGRRRYYFAGRQLDGVMNYPLRRAILDYLAGRDALYFRLETETLMAHYPPQAFASAMNFLGTHDTERILNVLGCRHRPERAEERAGYRLTPQERARGEALERLASAILYACPGSPMLYYGDEAGMEGFEDPFNRRTFPENPESPLGGWYELLGQCRRRIPALQRGDFRILCAKGGALAFERRLGERRLLCLCNRADAPQTFDLPAESDGEKLRDLLGSARPDTAGGRLRCTLPPVSAAWLA